MNDSEIILQIGLGFKTECLIKRTDNIVYDEITIFLKLEDTMFKIYSIECIDDKELMCVYIQEPEAELYDAINKASANFTNYGSAIGSIYYCDKNNENSEKKLICDVYYRFHQVFIIVNTNKEAVFWDIKDM